MINITRGNVCRIRPRVFRELATITLEPGDKVQLCHDWLGPTEITKAWSVRCTRATRKNGKPISQWIFLLDKHFYRLQPGDARRLGDLCRLAWIS